MSDLLSRVVRGTISDYAIIARALRSGRTSVDIVAGTYESVGRLEELRVDHVRGPQYLLAVPFRQAYERGFPVIDDGADLLALRITEHEVRDLEELLALLPRDPVPLRNGGFDESDDAYRQRVQRVIDEEIREGTGANFVVRRSYQATAPGWSNRQALSVLRNLLRREEGAYWTFLVQAPSITLIGATPERHLSINGGEAIMNPISGTLRYVDGKPSADAVLRFLADTKETDELYMVLDEELKMMAQICHECQVRGPFVREMARLAHTEYLIEGRIAVEPTSALQRTLFAPTVTGSPVESAFDVIARHEHSGRGYYSGVIALLGADAAGQSYLDSAIIIRSAEISSQGNVTVGVGATLVRHSVPEDELRETEGKLATILGAFDGEPSSNWFGDPRVVESIARRNDSLADFWLGRWQRGETAELKPRRITVYDAEDTFTAMIAQQLRTLGMDVQVLPWSAAAMEDSDLVVMGPGPGDPRDLRQPKMAALRDRTLALLASETPLIAVCLSHQILCSILGLQIRRRPVPNQGGRRVVDLFGRSELVGFYNSFSARAAEGWIHDPRGGRVELARNGDEVDATRGRGFASIQFHPESVLTQHGPGIWAELIDGLALPNGAVAG